MKMNDLKLHHSHRRAMRIVVPFLLLLALVQLLAWLIPTPEGLRGISNYLPLHILFETVAIVVSMLAFAVGWNSHDRDQSGNIVLLSCAFFAAGWLNISHMLSYNLMPDFVTPSGPEKAIDFWLATRFTVTLALLFSAIRPWRPFASASTRYPLMAAGIAFVLLVNWLVLFHQDVIPRTFIPGQGLTPFKIYMEYLLVALNLSAALALLFRMNKQLPFDAALLFGAVCVMAMSELYFTLYVDVTDIFNLLGHVYTVIAYLLVYRAIVAEGIEAPYQKLDEARQNLELAIHASSTGLWDWNIATDEVDYSTEWKAQLGYRPDELANHFSTWEELLHPEDKEQALKLVHDFMASQQRSYENEFRLRHRDGSYRWMLAQGEKQFDEHGKLTRLVGSHIDITERKKTMIALAKAQAVAESAAVDAAMLELSKYFLSMQQLVIEDISDRVLDAASKLTGSEFGFVGYIDADSGFLVSPTLMRDIWDQCSIAGKSIVFEKWSGLWGWVLTNKKPLLSNEPSADPRSGGIPQGHVQIRRFLSAPALAGEELIGMISLANADHDYTERDLAAIERLADFYAIVVRRMRSEKELQEYREMLTMSMQAASAGAWKWDSATNRATWSDENYRLMGLEPGSVEPCYAAWLERVHPDDRERAGQQVAEAIAAKSDLDIEFRIVRPDGTLLWINDLGRMIPDANGEPVGMFGLQMDITERKQSEQKLRESLAEQEVMMREIHHRVKNNLQTMSNLLELQSTYVRDETALGLFRDSQQRIQSMAMIHAQLYQNKSMANIDFAAYLQTLVNNLRVQYSRLIGNVVTRIDAQPCILSVDTAIPCGLLVNELVTNAMKHAFPNGRSGEIQISIEAGDEGKIALGVADNGVGMPAEPCRKGFGMVLIELMVEKQLHGKLTIEPNNPGTRVLCMIGVSAARQGREFQRVRVPLQ